jgi:hypothetical protein
MTTSDSTVTFYWQAHSTLFFADLPQRVVGHIHTKNFVRDWGEGDNNFAEDPRTRFFPSCRKEIQSQKK